MMNLAIKKPSIPVKNKTIEPNEPGQRILIGIIFFNEEDIVIEGSLNEYLDRIQWEIDDLGAITINSEGTIIQADFNLDESELEKLKLWSITSYHYLLTGKSAHN